MPCIFTTIKVSEPWRLLPRPGLTTLIVISCTCTSLCLPRTGQAQNDSSQFPVSSLSFTLSLSGSHSLSLPRPPSWALLPPSLPPSPPLSLLGSPIDNLYMNETGIGISLVLEHIARGVTVESIQQWKIADLQLLYTFDTNKIEEL